MVKQAIIHADIMQRKTAGDNEEQSQYCGAAAIHNGERGEQKRQGAKNGDRACAENEAVGMKID